MLLVPVENFPLVGRVPVQTNHIKDVHFCFLFLARCPFADKAHFLQELPQSYTNIKHTSVHRIYTAHEIVEDYKRHYSVTTTDIDLDIVTFVAAVTGD